MELGPTGTDKRDPAARAEVEIESVQRERPIWLVTDLHPRHPYVYGPGGPWPGDSRFGDRIRFVEDRADAARRGARGAELQRSRRHDGDRLEGGQRA